MAKKNNIWQIQAMAKTVDWILQLFFELHFYSDLNKIEKMYYSAIFKATINQKYYRIAVAEMFVFTE